MLRITEMENGNGNVVLKLEGRIVGPWVTELEQTSGRFLDAGQNLKLHLADVWYVDRQGVALLKALKRKRVVLQGCSPFVAEELREDEGPVANSGRKPRQTEVRRRSERTPER